MQNLNQVIKPFLCACAILYCIKQDGYCQTAPPVPRKFQNLPITAKVLEKDTELTIDSNKSQDTQNIVLDKTGFILYIPSVSKNVNIKIISTKGEEQEIFNFIDEGIFTLLDSEKTYSIIQEVIPDCTKLAKKFGFDDTTTICPDKEEFKILENIMILSNTSLDVRLPTPTEFFTIALSLPEVQLFDEKFNYTHISNENLSTEELRSNTVNIANLLKLGKLCIVGTTKIKSKPTITTCSFEKNNVKSIITYESDFKNKAIQNNNLNLIFSSLPLEFSTSNHETIFELVSNVVSNEPQKEINKNSQEKLFLENHITNINFNLGLIPSAKTKVRKNTFTLKSPIQLDSVLKKTAFNIPMNQLEVIINPFSNKSNESVLANLKIKGIESNSLDTFSISLDNNIVVKNLSEPTEEEKSRVALQKEDNSKLRISTYLPSKSFNVTLNSLYSFIEQNITPTVDESGKSKDVISNKSKEDLTLIKDLGKIDLSTAQENIDLNIKKASKLLDNTLFNNQFSLSGFLIPPDARPVVQPPYRATIELFMSIKLTNTDSLSIQYSDLKTKDEAVTVNFFKFSFLPQGKYETKVKFNGDRIELFKTAGVVKPK